MKKLSVFLLSIIICTAFFGCSANQANTEENPSTASGITAVSTTQTESTIRAKTETEPTGNTTASSENTQTTTAAQNQNGNSSTAQAREKTTAANKNTAGNQTGRSTTTRPAETKKQTTTASTITCTVTIECTSILDHMDNLKAGHEDIIPSNGYILSSCSVTLPNNSTAYDAVKAACESHGVIMTSVSSSMGKYISGFNNIDEKDCGSQSGWLYFVNGNSPSKSCSKYTLSNGDNVVFSYTCS